MSKDIDRIREKVRLRLYDMSAHAMEEMAEDLLTILDVEMAILNSQVTGSVIYVVKIQRQN